MMLNLCVCLLLFIRVCSVHGHPAMEEPCSKNDDPLSYREYFYVGGEYEIEESTAESFMTGQMYVEKLTPVGGPRQPHPLVLIHGKSLTGATWLNTPDGRPGWASYFLCQGYAVYIVDQPTRGRSAWRPGNFMMTTWSTQTISQWFTATHDNDLWPQAVKLEQWPGQGMKGDPVFDAFFASTVQFLSNDTEAQVRMQDAGVALLDRIGAAVLIAHSQGGYYVWTIADARPHLVKGIITVEPAGPPFRDAAFFGGRRSRSWGMTDIPVTYEPPVLSPDEILTTEVPSNDTNLMACVLQKEPARTLSNLKAIPVLIEVSEASYHAVYDHCSVAFLQQAGVDAMLLRLEDVGIKGNGHLQYMEKNNLEIAEVLHKWVQEIAFGQMDDSMGCRWIGNKWSWALGCEIDYLQEK